MTRRAVAALVYVAIMVGLAIVAAWPIYQVWWFVVVAVVSAAVGMVGAVLSKQLKWPGWLTGIVMVAVAYTVALGVAVPSHWRGGTVFPDGARDAALGFVLGFKDLITAPLPVGEYRNLMVPVVGVFVAGTFIATRFALSSGRRIGVAALAGGGMLFFGLLFGRTSVSAPMTLGPVKITAPIETGIGIAGLLASVIWLSWRARDERRQAIALAAKETGIRSTKNRSTAGVRRFGLAAGMLAIAVAVGATVTPVLTETNTRDVLRSAIGPEVVITDSDTPLTNYRANFSDANVEEVLFSYSSAGSVPQRIRLATLGDYDGESFAIDVAPNNPYLRVPSKLAAGHGVASTVKMEIGSLRGIFLPLFGSLEQVQFQGSNGPDLADEFYYNAKSGTGVVVDGLSEGDTYLVTAVEKEAPALESAQSPGAKPAHAAPESLLTWLDAQDAPRGGAGLSQVLTALRERGYLSHSLLAEVEGQSPRWTQLLPGYTTFQPSAAGHSLARIDDLFTQLLDRESKMEGVEDPSLVAAVGDDEQFAVASALIAEQFGFPSRVVVGVRTTSESLPVCDGECVAGDLAVWLEVQDADGAWIAVDTTPQYTESVDQDTRRQRDPENATDVRPRDATEVAPPDPTLQDSDNNNQQQSRDNSTRDVLEILRWSGIGVLGLILLLAPFLTVLIAKISRRRSRADSEDAAERISGGWEEYVDAAVDAGKPVPVMQTRLELADQYETPSGRELAARADLAQFSTKPITRQESDEFWAIVNKEREAIKKENSWWGRVRAALSLKSFVRELSTVTPKPKRSKSRYRKAGVRYTTTSIERGKRPRSKTRRS